MLRCLLLLSSILATALTNEICMNSKKVKSFIKTEPADLESSILNVSISLDIRSLIVIPYSNHLEIEATVTREWSVPDYFRGESICNDLSVTRLKSLIPYPQIGYTNAISVSVSSHSTRIKLKQDGTFVHQEKIKQSVPCTTNSSSYPFGNTTCQLTWHIDDSLGVGSEYHWNEIKIRSNESGDVWFTEFDRLEDDTKIEIVFHFLREKSKIFCLFYLPSIFFLLGSWTSLLLGPMLLTRTVLTTMSMVSLMLLYFSNMAGVYDTLQMNMLDTWKLFTYSFVLLVSLEMVVVTLLISLGEARCLRRNSKKYEMEPLYEEMNDLRTRKTPRTIGYCGWLACFVDIAAFVAMGLYFWMFVTYYRNDTEWLIETVETTRSHFSKLFFFH